MLTSLCQLPAGVIHCYYGNAALSSAIDWRYGRKLLKISYEVIPAIMQLSNLCIIIYL